MPTALQDLPKKEPKTFNSGLLELEVVVRAASGDAVAADAPPAEPEIWAVLSSETPCETYFGTEVLSHEKSAIDMSIARFGVAMHLDHGGLPFRPTPDPALHIGHVDPVELRTDRKLWGKLNFSQHELAQRTKASVLDRTYRFGSVYGMKLRRKVVRSPEKMGDPREDLVTRWRPEEFSLVSIPADPTSQTKVARAAGADEFPVEYEFEATPATQEEPAMPPVEPTPAAPAPASAAPAAVAAEPAPSPVARSAGAAVADPPAATPDQILALCEAQKVPFARAREFLTKNLTLREVKEILFDERAAGSNGGLRQPGAEMLTRAADPRGLAARDRRRYSVRRAILQAIAASSGTGQFDGVEGEWHEELSRNRPANYQGIGGFLIPLDTLTEDERYERGERLARAMGTGVAGGGAELVFDQPREMLDILRNRMLCIQFGAEVLTGLQGNVPFPVQTGDPTAYFVGENPASGVTQSQLAWVTRMLSAKEAAAQVVMSRRLLEVASFDAEMRSRTSLMAKFAVLWDRQGLHGKGTDGECTGIANVPGVATVAMGGAPVFGKIVDLETAVTDANVFAGTMGYITTPPIAGKAKQTPVISGAAAGMLWTGKGPDGEMNGYRAGATKQVDRTLGAGSDEHGIFFGDWSAVLFAYWGALEISVDSTSAVTAGKGQVVLTANQLGDVLLTRPEAMAFGTGLKPA